MKTVAQIREERKQKRIEVYNKFFDAIHTDKIVWRADYHVGKYNKDNNFIIYQNYLYATVNDEIVAEIDSDEFENRYNLHLRSRCCILKNSYQEAMKDVIDEFPDEFENYLFLSDSEIDAVFEKEVEKALLAIKEEHERARERAKEKEFIKSHANLWQQINKRLKRSKTK